MTDGGKLAIFIAALAGVVLAGGGAIAAALLTNKKACGPQPPAPSTAIANFATAISIAEGSNPAWNNPGSLTASFGFPTTGTANAAGVLMFNSCADGWNALFAQLIAIVNGNSRYSLNDSIATLGLGYSGGDPNWSANVSSVLGVDANTPLGQVLT